MSDTTLKTRPTRTEGLTLLRSEMRKVDANMEILRLKRRRIDQAITDLATGKIGGEIVDRLLEKT